MTSAELRQKRRKLAEQAAAIVALAEREDRDLTSEEQSTWDGMHADIDSFGARIERMERVDTLEEQMAESRGARAGQFDAGGDVENRNRPDRLDPETRAALTEEQRKIRTNVAIKTWLLRGPEQMQPEHRGLLRPAGSIPDAILDELPAGMRAEVRQMSATTATEGAEFVPELMLNEVTNARDSFSGIRKTRVRVIRTDGGGTFNLPGSDDTANSAVIYAENAAIDADVEPATSEVALGSYLYNSKIVLVPIQLLQDATFDMVAYLAEILGERFARGTEAHYCNGSGTGQPNGVNNATAVAGTAALNTYALVLDMEHAVDPEHRANGEWLVSDAILKVLKGVVDGNSRPLWVPSIAAPGQPDTIMGYPYTVTNSLPATGAGSAVFGDMRRYVIRDVRRMEMFRFAEKYMSSMQVGFMAWGRTDGDINDPGGNALVASAA